jgi:photosystem II stability/assembly factor-like uncharacterized protein
MRASRQVIVPALLVGIATVLLLGGCASSSGGVSGKPPVVAVKRSQVPANTWRAQNPPSVGARLVLKAVDFVDATHGWAVGYKGGGETLGDSPGLIMATSDGGATWHEQDASSAGSTGEFSSVSFADPTHGVVVGERSDDSGAVVGTVILTTSDGGATWQMQDSSTAQISTSGLNSVSLADAVHGWAVGYKDLSTNVNPIALIQATSDGGATWHEQDTTSAGENVGLGSVSFIDATHGWAIGSRGVDGGDSIDVVMSTTDGGATWRTQDIGGGGGPTALESVTFVDATHGWAVGNTPTGENGVPVGLIMATSDGGATWSTQDAGAAGSEGEFYSVSFADAKQGWVVGSSPNRDGVTAHSVILATSDGGATWKAQDASSAGSSSALVSVSFVDATHGWAVGDLGDDTARLVGSVIVATGK